MVGWCTVTWSRLPCKMAMLGQFLCVPRNFEIFHDRLGPDLRNYITTLTLLGFQLLAWNLVGWCTVPWSRSLSKMAMLWQLLLVGRNFEIFHDKLGPGSEERWLILGSVRKSHYGLKFVGMMQFTMKQITIWNGHAQPMFVFSDFSQPKVLLFSECLVQNHPRVYCRYLATEVILCPSLQKQYYKDEEWQNNEPQVLFLGSFDQFVHLLHTFCVL